MAEPPLWSTLLGPTIQDSRQGNHDTDVILGGIQLVGIYFANRKISRSSRFKPHLKNFYEKINKDGKRFEVVVVSLDKTLDDYLFSFPEKSQWYALEFGNPLIKKLDIRFEPPGGFCMTIVTSDGTVIREEGDSDITRDNKGGKRTFKTWESNANIGAPPKKDAPAGLAPAEEKPAEVEVKEEEPLPVNSDGSTLAWTAQGAEYILPWPMNRWRSTPVDNHMVTAEQLKLILETKGLVTKAPRPGAKDPTIEDLMVKLLDTKYVVPKAKEVADAENAETVAKAEAAAPAEAAVPAEAAALAEEATETTEVPTEEQKES